MKREEYELKTFQSRLLSQYVEMLSSTNSVRVSVLKDALKVSRIADTMEVFKTLDSSVKFVRSNLKGISREHVIDVSKTLTSVAYLSKLDLSELKSSIEVNSNVTVKVFENTNNEVKRIQDALKPFQNIVSRLLPPTINIPNVTIPSINIPKVNFPTIDIPKVTLPSVEIPKINIPDISIKLTPPSEKDLTDDSFNDLLSRVNVRSAENTDTE